MIVSISPACPSDIEKLAVELMCRILRRHRTVHQLTPSEQCKENWFEKLSCFVCVCWWVMPAKNVTHLLHRQLLTV